ncbi:thioesterase family protein [Sphingomonas daechungensis]|uniref:acyl-CoA thioesterase n=1 Tax=Sphingomonas daechungensis TaxID=1176646 RepID=UPI0031EBB9B8
MPHERHPFDIATDLVPTGPDSWIARTRDAYWNMVGPFGGLVTALLFKSALVHPARRGEPVALTVNFCAPVAKGEMHITALPARTNRSTQHWTMTMLQEGECVATASAMFGKRPETFSDLTLLPPDVPPFEDLERMPWAGAGWIERFDLRFAQGAPFWAGSTEGASSRSTLWIASDPPRPLDFVGLAALTDIFFGRIIHIRQQMVPFGTVSLTSYFHATEDDLKSLGPSPVLGTAEARIFDRGFHDQSAQLWSEGGRLLATSHQLVYFRDPA